MGAVIFLLATAGLLTVVAAMISYNYLPSNKVKLWLCGVLRRAAPFLQEESVGVAVPTEVKKKKKGVVAVARGRAELERVFATFDKNGDGYITLEELEESLQKLGLSATSEELACLVEKLDANGDGLLDLGEFWELYNSVGGATATEEDEEPGTADGVAEEVGEGDLKEAFDVFDSNGDGLITVDELGKVLAALGLAPGATAARCREMIQKVDMDGDGMVSFEEFKRMMRGPKDRKLF
ncbi:hypothetical protein Taro_052500 [Colocasia esculenta]|uniref:EF-hand domain-containing protein n=1 Tax=Colocasia esculenta TaxID=4460 RepID=A0A843XK93_COLES|nr:hypothetical protein [Colocasia esculenta]